MDADAGEDGLRQGLESLVALESRLDESIAALSAGTTGYLEAPTIVETLRSLVAGQREALRAHLEGLGEKDVPLVPQAISATTALGDVASALTETALAYAALHALAHRFYEVDTANLADRHRATYLQALGAVHRAVADMVVQEVLDAGHACRCECPACAPGICLCWHVHVDPETTGVETPSEGIIVRAPRSQSNAELAGIRHGDVILAIDGQEIRSYQDVLDRMRDHQPGDDVSLRVRRGTGDVEELVLTR
jgi:hypothetical protein